MKKYKISVGRSRLEVKWAGKEVTWDQLCDYLSNVKLTVETVAEYKAMTKGEQAAIKDIGGFVSGSLKGPHRRASEVVSRSLVTLDIDNGDSSTIERIEAASRALRYVLHSTHSHTPESPRYRLIYPLDREVTPDEYVPIARAIAQRIGIAQFDASTYEPSRLMYWPSASSDAEVVTIAKRDGQELSADEVLGSYKDWRDVREWPMGPGELKVKGGSVGKVQDPTEKKGLIGAWCQTYSISEVIERYLPDTYERTSSDDRWTYVAGSSAGGLIVYEDKWAFSHHGTDPAGGKLCNAFDLVRLHKFGALDVETDTEMTPVNRQPSYIAMADLAKQDQRVKVRLIEEQGNRPIAADDYAGLLGEGEDWKAELRLDKRGQIISTMYNFDLILAKDPGLTGSFKHNTFEDRTELTRDLPWRKMGTDTEWTSADDAGLLSHISTHYNNLSGKQAILDSFELAKLKVQYHPVREYLDSLPEWDGVPRLDTLLVDYLGADDNELTRAMTRKQFVAAVTRIYKPGTKYDYVLTLIGAEALGKSSLVRIMGGEWFSDSLGTIEGKEGMESIRGSWLIECSELTNYKRSTSESYKSFISKQADKFRPAYARRAVNLKRQCVFFATTNETTFLKGDTGNRRFWPVVVGKHPRLDVNEHLPMVRAQVWAEAIYYYKQGEELFLPANLEEQARERQAGHNEIQEDSRIGMIQAFIEMPVPTNWYSLTAEARRDYVRMGKLSDYDDQVKAEKMRRETISAVEVLNELFGQALDDRNRYRTREVNTILRDHLGLVESGYKRDVAYGKQRMYSVPKEPNDTDGTMEQYEWNNSGTINLLFQTEVEQ